MQFGSTIKELCDFYNISQVELAEKAELTQAFLSLLINGKRNLPKDDTVMKIIFAFQTLLEEKYNFRRENITFILQQAFYFHRSIENLRKLVWNALFRTFYLTFPNISQEGRQVFDQLNLLALLDPIDSTIYDTDGLSNEDIEAKTELFTKHLNKIMDALKQKTDDEQYKIQTYWVRSVNIDYQNLEMDVEFKNEWLQTQYVTCKPKGSIKGLWKSLKEKDGEFLKNETKKRVDELSAFFK